jgi:hypothetical protein
MAIYKCSKCGMSFTSKCAKTHKVFEHNLPSGLPVPLAWDVIVGEIESKETYLYTEEEIKCALCEHDLVLESDTCLFGCCKKKPVYEEQGY